MQKYRCFIISFIVIMAVISNHAYANTLSEQRIIFSSEKKSSDYVYTLGSLKTINAKITAEREQRITGNLTRTTYEFDRDLSLAEAWAMTRQHYALDRAKAYYSCKGLDCGSSNAWANDRFVIKQLYGLDVTQRYHAFSPSDNETRYIALYFIQRGNKRIFLQVDSVDVATLGAPIAASASVILDKLQRERWFALYLHDDAVLPDEFVQLSLALRKNPLLKFSIVGHHYSASSVQKNIEDGLIHAQKLKQVLIQEGIKSSRISVYSVGNLSPRLSMKNTAVPPSRIEIVTH